MKKILFLENDLERLKATKMSSENPKIEAILGNQACNQKIDNFIKNQNNFNIYDTIIIHESIYNEKMRDSLFKTLNIYCRHNKKFLVKFSGDNSQSLVHENNLTMSDRDFYENIEAFLDYSDKSNLFVLAYGRNWTINPLLNTLQELNLFIENFDKDTDILFDELELDFDFLVLKKILKKDEYETLFKNIELNEEISIKDVKIISKNFKKLIKRKTND